MTNKQVEEILLDSLNMISEEPLQSIDIDMSLSDLGIDSLGLTKLLMNIEDAMLDLDRELEPESLDEMFSAQTLRTVHDVLLARLQ